MANDATVTMTTPPPAGSLDAALAALRGPARPEELLHAAATVEAMANALRLAASAGEPDGATTSLPTSSQKDRRSMLAKLITMKTVGALTAGMLSVGTAAAATGNLPLPLSGDGAVETTSGEVTSTTGESSEGTSTTEGPTSDSTALSELTDPSLVDNSDQPAGSTSSTTTSPAGQTTGSTTPVPELDAACEDASNHGAYVSGVAREMGDDHGGRVSSAAQSDCGRDDRDDHGEDSDDGSTTDTSAHHGDDEHDEDGDDGIGSRSEHSGRGNNPGKSADDDSAGSSVVTSGRSGSGNSGPKRDDD